MTPESASTTADASALRHPRSRAHRMVMGGLLFALLGPPLGAVMVSCALAAVAVWEGGATASAVVDSLPFLPLMMLFSYPAGVVPALATGIAVGSLSPRLTGWRIAFAGGVAGELTSAAFYQALRWEPIGAEALAYGALGIVPGALLAYVFFRRDATRNDHGDVLEAPLSPAPQ